MTTSRQQIESALNTFDALADNPYQSQAASLVRCLTTLYVNEHLPPRKPREPEGMLVDGYFTQTEIDVMRSCGKIAGIREYRNRTRASLRDAKNYVETYGWSYY